MFVLRVITGGNVETNQSLGDDYNYVDEHSEDFKKCMTHVWGEKWEKEADNEGTHAAKTYAFISYNSGEVIRPLYKTQSNYIMTGEGKTFANVTYVGNR